MTKFLPILFLCTFLSACNKSGGGSSADCVAIEAEEAGAATCTVGTGPIVSDDTTVNTGTTSGGSNGSNTGLPNAAYTFDEEIVFINMDADQEDKFLKALEMIKKVVATEEFRSKVLNHTYKGKKTFVDNGGYTNAQIYQKILDAAEKLFPAKNNKMNMEVELYYEASTTIGYTYGTSKRIWVNTKYFNTNSTAKVASNLFHEWLHKVGFGHAASYSTSRDYSVPYAIGRMISTIGPKL